MSVQKYVNKEVRNKKVYIIYIYIYIYLYPVSMTHQSAVWFAEDLQLVGSSCPVQIALQQCQGDRCLHAKTGSFARTHQSAAWLA